MSTSPPTDLARWRRIEAILDLALDLPPEELNALLEKTCAGDPGLRCEVEAALAADAQAGGFLGVPAGEYAPELLAEDEEEGEDLAGHQVGPYRLLDEIGGGGMGTVYEAEDTRLGRRVAVKLLPPEYSRDRKAKERFLREARAAAAVDHPNLCTVHDVGESDGRLYIVLSFYEGETLRERIRRGPLPLAEARDVAVQVARGLARAHEAGIVHRDIKPANVILTRRGEAKILDFGIARLQGDEASLTRTGASWGTPAYMSPEQARGEPVDGRTDIWSLGVMLYEMVAGRRPFGGESLESMVSAIQTREPEPLERVRPDVPPELARVVEKALAKDPAERYGSAAELLEDLEAGRGPGPSWRKKALLLVSALALLVVVLLWRPWRFMSGPPLRVAVLKPVVESVKDDPELAFVASDVVRAMHSALLGLDGLQPLDPPEKDEPEGSEAQRLREADEALLPSLSCREDACQVTFSRRKPGGAVVAMSDPFEVQGGFDNAFQLAEGVRAHVQEVYSDRRLRPESPGAAVRPQDYSGYIELQRRFDSGKLLGEAELARLDSLLETSPGLIGAYALGTDIARILGDADRALAYAERAEALAPYDPRPRIARLRAELRANRLAPASATLERLETLAPGDARVKAAKAELLETRGDLGNARGLREEVARRRPTWRNILNLARLEFRLGASGSASRRLQDLLKEQPDNQIVWDQVAGVEAVYGDPHRAAALWEKLVQVQPISSVLSNLGLTYYLLGDHPAAAAAYRRALVLEPDYPWSRFSLATSLDAQGRAEAKQLYRALERDLAAMPEPRDTRIALLHADCLARLGQQLEATLLADHVLSQRPDDVQTLHRAAQIYASLGKPNRVYYYMELALEKGMGRAWFTIPEFRSLNEEDPKFRALLDRYTARKAAR